MNEIYFFDERVILRTPRFPLSRLENHSDTGVCCQNKDFMEALYLASPALHEASSKWQAGKITKEKNLAKLTHSISKYYSRMSSRCTPFGLFSGCSVVRWGEGETDIRLDDEKITRHTRLDMSFLNKLNQYLIEIEEIRDVMFFFSNNSLYRINNEFRFVEYSYSSDIRNYRISSLPYSEYLSDILAIAGKGALLDQIRQYLTSKGNTSEETDYFITELIKAQILVPETEPNISGKQCLDRLIGLLEKRGLKKSPRTVLITDTLKQVSKALRLLDENTGQGIQGYLDILASIKQLGIDYDEARFFQADVFPTLQKNVLSRRLQNDISGALSVLNKLTPFKQNENLVSFASRFRERYGDKEMPLSEVLDIETGIGYIEGNAVNPSPLISELQFAAPEMGKKFSWSRLEAFLHAKLIGCREKRSPVIEISDLELEAFKEDWHDLPPSLSILFRMVRDDRNYLFIEHTGGSSAANLLGRFAHGHSGISRLAHDITEHEQSLDPDIAYAEIIHQPENRTGNILHRPSFRKYEIPYLSQAAVESECQIDVTDLYVSIHDNSVILRSGKLNKRVIPRLSTAHNYSGNSLPVYLFLCELQLQDQRGDLNFSWGIMEAQYKFLPRAVYKNTILSLGRWQFSSADIAPLYKQGGNFIMTAVQEFRQKWQIPVRVVLAEGDHELPIDLEDPCSVNILLASVKEQDSFTLKEFLPADTSVKNAEGDIYANQFITSLCKKEASYKEPHSFTALFSPDLPLEKFEPGSQWLYYKLYCGTHTADRILQDIIKPLVADLLAKGLIVKWFFIRYYDPEFHLRVRLHVKDIRQIGEIIHLFKSAIDAPLLKHYIWKTQVDTYIRELKRYGHHSIDMSEEIFFYDSVAFLEMLAHTGEGERENIKWAWGMQCIDRFLDNFGLSLEEKISLAANLKNNYPEELGPGSLLRTQINQKYRENKKTIECWMDNEGAEGSIMHVLSGILNRKSGRIREIAEKIAHLKDSGKLEMPVGALLASYIHMMLNRIITNNPNEHEMVIYDFLYRYYVSLYAKNTKQSQVSHCKI